jgi:hypothetical protein
MNYHCHDTIMKTKGLGPCENPVPELRHRTLCLMQLSDTRSLQLWHCKRLQCTCRCGLINTIWWGLLHVYDTCTYPDVSDVLNM